MGIFYIRRHVHFRLWCFGWDGLLGSGTRLVAKLVLACFPDVRIVITFNAYPTVEGSEMKHSEILREAKKRLWDGVSRRRVNQASTICFAIILVSREGKDIYRAREIQTQIQEALDEQGYVSQWLNQQAGIPEELLTHRNMQEYRHRWLDELIRIYEEAGK